jgi:divalent metal cation (Fe/Co/Zn/Cd) transporter
MVKLPILDPIAGLFVSGLIMKAAIELGWDSLRDLTDENVDEKLQADVATLLRSMHEEGVLSFHRLRGRAMGPFVLMDVHISVDPTISVSAAHQIAERARIRVRQKLPVVAEFMVHVDVAHGEPRGFRSVFETPPRETGGGDEHGAAARDDEQPKEIWQGSIQLFKQEHIGEIVREYKDSLREHLALAADTKDHPLPVVKEGEEGRKTVEVEQEVLWRLDAQRKRRLDAMALEAKHDTSKLVQPSSTSASSAPPSKSTSSPSSPATSAPSPPTPSSPKPITKKLASTLKHLLDPPSLESLSSPPLPAGVASSPEVQKASRTMDLSTLMRPQAMIERDVRAVLADPHASYAPHVKGVSHFTCHYEHSARKLRVQLDLAFQSDHLTIGQASSIAKAIERKILAQVKDVTLVDIHLELTDEHIMKVKQTEPPRELPSRVTPPTA